MKQLLLGSLVICGFILLHILVAWHNDRVDEMEKRMTLKEKEKNKKECQEFDNIVGGIFLFIICSLFIFTIYCSARYEYYVNDELSLLKHDRYKDKVCVIDIDKKSYPKRTDFFWKLCFRYRYLKNNEKHSLIRIDKFKQKAIYLTDDYKKYGFVED